MVFQKRSTVTTSQIGKDVFVLDSTHQAIHKLNWTAAQIFRLCDGFHTCEAIVLEIEATFDAPDSAQIRTDVVQTLNLFESKHLITTVDGNSA